MTQLINIHSENPQPRLLNQVVDILKRGGVIAYPTDTAYALGCRLGDKSAAERIRTIRHLEKEHNFTLVCKDLSVLATYAMVDNSIFRLLKAYTPGPYTFILEASAEVPRRLQHPKRKSIGLRIPDDTIVHSLLEAFDEPLMSVTLILPGDEMPLSDPEIIFERLYNCVDAVIDGGFRGFEPTSVIDCIGGVPKIIREGKGDVAPFKM